MHEIEQWPAREVDEYVAYLRVRNERMSEAGSKPDRRRRSGKAKGRRR